MREELSPKKLLSLFIANENSKSRFAALPSQVNAIKAIGERMAAGTARFFNKF